jgi:hypothetical protein
MRLSSGKVSRALAFTSFTPSRNKLGLLELDRRFEVDHLSSPMLPPPLPSLVDPSMFLSPHASQLSTSGISLPSSSSHGSQPSTSSGPQEDILRNIQGLRLLTTTGLSGTELSSIIGGLEMCGICGKLFTGTALRLHIVGCVAARENEEMDLSGWFEDEDEGEGEGKGEEELEEEDIPYEGKGKGRAV